MMGEGEGRSGQEEGDDGGCFLEQLSNSWSYPIVYLLY